jgi:serine/threonine protein kinase
METQSLIGGRYRLERVLGRGGHGTTYVAADTRSGERVVVKLLTMGELGAWSQVEVFERETRVLKALDHEAIPRYIDSFRRRPPTATPSRWSSSTSRPRVSSPWCPRDGAPRRRRSAASARAC